MFSDSAWNVGPGNPQESMGHIPQGPGEALPTFSLLSADMRQVEDGQELLFLFEVGAVVHLIRTIAGEQGQSWGRRLPLVLNRWGRRASLSQHPPSLPPLLGQQFLLLLLGGQAKKLQKL